MLMTTPRGHGRPRAEMRPLTPLPAEIVQIRPRLGRTQEALAAALGVTTTTVSRWGRGAREGSLTVLQLARQLLAQHEDDSKQRSGERA
jgi:DNA-binding transcriptional regulator YiaG